MCRTSFFVSAVRGGFFGGLGDEPGETRNHMEEENRNIVKILTETGPRGKIKLPRVNEADGMRRGGRGGGRGKKKKVVVIRCIILEDSLLRYLMYCKSID